MRGGKQFVLGSPAGPASPSTVGPYASAPALPGTQRAMPGTFGSTAPLGTGSPDGFGPRVGPHAQVLQELRARAGLHGPAPASAGGSGQHFHYYFIGGSAGSPAPGSMPGLGMSTRSGVDPAAVQTALAALGSPRGPSRAGIAQGTPGSSPPTSPRPSRRAPSRPGSSSPRGPIAAGRNSPSGKVFTIQFPG